MKKLIFCALMLSGCCLLNGQTDSSLRRKPASYETDSVKSGNKTFEGGRHARNKSQGDTLPAQKRGSSQNHSQSAATRTKYLN